MGLVSVYSVLRILCLTEKQRCGRFAISQMHSFCCLFDGMHEYKLKNTDDDRAFLDDKVIKCQAFFYVQELVKKPLQQNDKLVVRLSNGKKYSGIVVSISQEATGNVIHSTLELRRQKNIA